MNIPIPPLSELHSALGRITEVLACELRNPTDRAPAWSESEWLIARAVSAMHGISQLLATDLRWRNAPSSWNHFLADQKTQIERRHPRIQALLQAIDDLAREENLPLLALKGSALHARGIYVSGERPMADVDLLVHPAHTDRAKQLIRSLGYRESRITPRELEFAPVHGQRSAAIGEHAANDVKIELHERIAELLPVRRVDITSLLLPNGDGRAGLSFYSSTATLMLHMLLHTTGEMARGGVRLIQLQDISRLSHRMDSSHWDQVLALAPRYAAVPWWMFPPLALTHRYVSSIPQSILDRTARGCPRTIDKACRLRPLAQWSLSHLWIRLLPGFDWTQTTGEKLEFAMQRLRGSRKMLATRNASFDQAKLAHSEWDRLTRGRRLARWLVARAPRLAPMMAVRGAFTSAAD